MTLENQVYGVPGWVCCVACTVKQPIVSLRGVEVLRGIWQQVCKDEKKCAEWKADLAQQRSIATKPKGKAQ